MAMIAHLIQDTASSLETRFLPPTVGIYRAYVRTGPIEECLALFQQAEEETQDVQKAEKAMATQQLYAELIMEALETSEMENSRVVALRRYIKNYVETLFERAKDPGCLLEELGNRLLPSLLEMDRSRFPAIVTEVVKAFIDANRVLNESLFHLFSHLASLDDSCSTFLPHDPNGRLFKSKIPPRPIVLLGPSLLSLIHDAKDIPSLTTDVVLVPLWRALKQKGWSPWQSPMERFSQEILQHLPVIMGKMPKALVDALRELGISHCGCGTHQCNQGILRALSLQLQKGTLAQCRAFLWLRSHILIFLAIFPTTIRDQLLGHAKELTFDMLFIPPPSSHVEGADCPKAQGSNLGPSISQIDSDPAEDLVGYTVGARGPSPPHQTTFSAPQSPGVNVDVSSPAEGELSASPTTPTPSTRPIRPLPSTSRRAIKTSESSPLIDLGSPAVTTSSSAIDGTVTEMNARGAVDPFDNDLKMDGGGQDLDDAPQTSAGSPSRSPIAGAFKRLFNGSPSSSLPSFFKRSRQVSPGASTNAILSASTSSSYGFGQVVISPSQTQSTSHDFRTPVSNVSDYMPPDSMYHTSSHVPEAEDMDVTPPRPLADQNPSSSDSPYHETPTKQTDSRRIPLGTATPRRSSSPDPAPAQGLPSEAETNLNVPANPGPFNKLKHLKAALGARFPPRKGSGGSGGASGSGRVASEQTLNTRSEVDQEAEAASDGQATTLLGVSRPKTRSVSLGSLLGKLGPGKRDDK